MIALIDADSIAYKVGFAIEDKVIWNEPEVLAELELFEDTEYYTDLDVCFRTVDGIVESILQATDCDSELLVLSGGGNFRLDLPTEYKANRKNVRKPEGYDAIMQYLTDNFNSKVVVGYEADDYVVYLKTTYPDDYVLCAIDKDVLKQTEGTHYNYSTGLEITVKKFEAIKFAYHQTLTGDATDGYKGCPSIGEAKATKILADCKTEKCLWDKVVETYRLKGLTANDAILTMQLANMHQFNGTEIELWNPSKIK
jgi:DNA polymerase-1